MAISPAMRQVALMVDRPTSNTTRRATLKATYLSELSRTQQALAKSVGARLVRVWACDASLYSAREYAGTQFLLAGDAATCIDPLSSSGVKKALSSAWLAAVALHTALVDPLRRDVAFGFYATRERAVYAAEVARTRAYARQAAAHHQHPFWIARGLAATEAPEDPIDRLLRREVVRAVHARLRATASPMLVAASDVPRGTLPRISGREIVVDEALLLSDQVVRYAAGVDLPAVLALAGSAVAVPDLYEAYCRATASVPLPQFLAGLSLLVAEGALRSAYP